MQSSGQGSSQGSSDAPIVIRSIPRGGGQFIVDKVDGRTVITSAALPPDVERMVRGAESTAIAVMVIIAAIFILGPFARMIARRMERRAEMAPGNDTLALRHQIETLQQSIDTMSIEIERISESQRFQSKMLFEKKDEPVRAHIS